jgi:hypothetical protein
MMLAMTRVEAMGMGINVRGCGRTEERDVGQRKQMRGVPKAEFKLRSATTSKFCIGKHIALATGVQYSEEKNQRFFYSTSIALSRSITVLSVI